MSLDRAIGTALQSLESRLCDHGRLYFGCDCCVLDLAFGLACALPGFRSRLIHFFAGALGRPVAVLGRPELSSFDLDEGDGGGPGDVARWQARLGAPLARASTWLSDRLGRGMRVLGELPGSFGA